MKLIVNTHKIEIERELVNEFEVNVTKIKFEFNEKIPNNYVKKAFFSNDIASIEVLLTNNECDIPNEVLTKIGQVRLGVIAYEVQNETLIERFNPSPVYFYVNEGSMIEANNTEPITPTDKEQMEQALQDGLNDIQDKINEVNTAIDETNNLDLDVSDKVDGDVTVTLTKKNASTKSVVISDGISLQFMWQGTSLGIKTDDMEEYVFVDLQGQVGPVGPQGNPFQVKKTYATVQLMIDDYDNMEINDYVMISGNIEEEDNAKLFVKTEQEDPVYRWQYLADFSGASGVVGPRGASVTSATINANGELVLTVE